MPCACRRRPRPRAAHEAHDVPIATTPAAGIALAGAAAGALGWVVGQHLQLSGDLRKFMPAPQTPAQHLLMDELGEGPGSRLLLVGAVRRRSGRRWRAQSQALRRQLARQSAVRAGRPTATSAWTRFRRACDRIATCCRTRWTRSALDAATLRDALDARVEDLGSPAASLVEPLIPSDPTLETLKLAESWQPANAPQRLHDVWFDRAGKQALLVAETVAPGFDPTGQQDAVNAIQQAFAAARGSSHSRLTLSGPGAFSVEIGGRTQREAGWIGTVDTISLVLLLWFAYRSWKAPLLGVLPLASAGLAGLGAVALCFDGVHGITVAFGFTLIGVVQDYPIHLFSHQHAGLPPQQGARVLWPTLATGVASTCIAYVTFLASGVDGLKQLAVFTITGLGNGGTDDALPAAVADRSEPARRRRFETAGAGVGAGSRDCHVRARCWRCWRSLAVGVIAFAPGAFWQNDLSKLTPVPAEAHGARRAAARRTRRARRALRHRRVGPRRRSGAARPANVCGRAWTHWCASMPSPATTSPRATCPAPPPSARARQSCPTRRRCDPRSPTRSRRRRSARMPSPTSCATSRPRKRRRR